MASTDRTDFSVIVVGGGIAGSTCVETLSAVAPEQSVLLLSASPVIKCVVNFKKLTETLAEFDVKEESSEKLVRSNSNLTVINQCVSRLDSNKQEVYTSDDRCFHYKKLCICTGAKPKIIAEDNPLVIGIRDTETILEFREKISHARRIVVVGNGGIATELVYNVQICDVIWAIKDESIVSTFVDAGAAKFFMSRLVDGKSAPSEPVTKRHKYKLEGSSPSTQQREESTKAVRHGRDVDIQSKQSGDDTSERDTAVNSRSGQSTHLIGASLGPDWVDVLGLPSSHQNGRSVQIEYKVEVKRLLTPEQFQTSGLTVDDLPDGWPLYVELTNNKVYGCDFVVSATGVTPNVLNLLGNNKFDVDDDGGLRVNEHLQTSVSNVYAAGDACHAAWEHSPHWLQMRLWSQALQMGHYAGKCIAADLRDELSDIGLDFCFELFAHCTRFFDYKVVLLGRFNGQGLPDNECELLIRVVEGEKYIKAVMQNGRLMGAVLIGETDLEETFENLILNQSDLSRYGEGLLEQDIEDYFD